MTETPPRKSPFAAIEHLAPSAVKECCAAVYDSDVARMLMGNSFHPGGTKLTERLGQLLGLTPRSRVLDVAAGNGTSAVFLADRFGCEVVGVDYSWKNAEAAVRLARAKGLDRKIRFQAADAEQLPFADASFDALVCECALCTFPDKPAAVGEFNRVLCTGGKVGLSDLTRDGELSPLLGDLMSWIACIADAQPLSAYVALLNEAQLTVRETELHDGQLSEFVAQMRMRLLAAEVMAGLQKLALPGFDFEAAKTIAVHAIQAIKQRTLGYALVLAIKDR